MSGAPGDYALITGGAGFIGTNLAHRLASAGRQVWILDDLSRPGVERNVLWLREQHGERVQLEKADVLNATAVTKAVRNAAEVYHLAAQVAVTTSLRSPTRDFEVNARGTLNVLEAMRARRDPPPLVFTSTNKVYGALDDVQLRVSGRRYVPVDTSLRDCGIGERRPLSFHSPYGCSKGAADQYVIDYARCFGLPAVVFRMSCICGPHQHGNEDQGWVAHFLIRARAHQPIVVYGDGLQVRDVLYVDDLMDAITRAMRQIDVLRGHAFNMGGGPGNTLSLIELIDLITQRYGLEPRVLHAPTRQGDQRYYVSNTQAFSERTGWTPRIAVEQGIGNLCHWLDSQASLDTAPLAVAAGQ